MAAPLSDRTTDGTNRCSPAEQRLGALGPYGQASPLSEKPEKEPVFTAYGPPVSQGRVPYRIGAGQRKTTSWVCVRFLQSVLANETFTGAGRGQAIAPPMPR